MLAGCKSQVAPQAPEWSKSSNCLVALGLRALGQELPPFPEPLVVGKSDHAAVKAWLDKLSLKPERVEEGQTADGGYRYLVADFGALRLVWFLASRGGFENKVTYMTCVVLATGEDDVVRPKVDEIFAAPGPPEKLVITSEEGRQTTDVDVFVWKQPFGVMTERHVYDEEENRTVSVLELWAVPAWGQERPQL